MSDNATNDNTARRAFIFDMDGTIVDNMGFHMTSWLEFFARRDMILDADAFFRDTAGRQSHEIMSTYFGKPYTKETSRELDDEKEALYRELYAPYLKTVAGFMDLIAKAGQQDVALAVATAAPNDNIAFTLDGLDLRRHFNAVVGAADVARGKPHPDVFLLAAERCGVDPSNAIVFEDAPLGVEAARRAGMRAVVLTTTLPASAFAAFDNVIAVVRDFSELDIATLFAADAPAN
ncbi:MAG: HAD family phosphatase [Burkholderiaceae bacterium]|nr:HAD family phosphatase [Burkholderiaceae bacterium]